MVSVFFFFFQSHQSVKRCGLLIVFDLLNLFLMHSYYYYYYYYYYYMTVW